MYVEEINMNNQITGGFIRHAITIIAGAIMANTTGDINTAVGDLLNNISSGESTALLGSAIAVFAILWSTWVKLTEEKKEAIVKRLAFKK